MEDFKDEGVSEEVCDVDEECIDEGVYFTGVFFEKRALGVIIRQTEDLKP